jgi:hypothetical protein
MQKHIRPIVSMLFVLLGLTATVIAQTVVPVDTTQKIPAKNATATLNDKTVLGAGDPVAIQSDIAKSDTAQSQVTAVMPIVLTKVPMLLLAEDAKLLQGWLGNIAIVNKDMPLENSLKTLNSSMPIGRIYKSAGEPEAKAFFEKYKVQIQKSFDQVGADREHLTAIAVVWTQIAATASTAVPITKISSGGN